MNRGKSVARLAQKSAKSRKPLAEFELQRNNSSLWDIINNNPEENDNSSIVFAKVEHLTNSITQSKYVTHFNPTNFSASMLLCYYSFT